MKENIIGSKQLKRKMQDIVYNQTNIDITIDEADRIIKEFTDFIRHEICNGNEVLINNFCKFVVKKYKHPKNEGYYNNPVAIFSKNFFRGEDKNNES